MSRTVPTSNGPLNTDITWEWRDNDDRQSGGEALAFGFPTITIGVDFVWAAHHSVTLETTQVDGKVTIPSCGHEFPLDLWYQGDKDLDSDDMAIATLMWGRGNVYHAHTYIGLIIPHRTFGDGSTARVALSRHLPNLTPTKD